MKRNLTENKNHSLSNEANYDHKNYFTDHSDYKTWIDIIYEYLGLNPLLTSLFVFVILFLVGLIFSYIGHFHQEYIFTPAMYVACFGISWVFFINHLASKKIHKAFEYLRPCFIVEDNEYKNKIRFWFSKFRNQRGNLSFSLILFIIGVIIIYFSIYNENILKQLHISSILRPSIFPSFWKAEIDRGLKFSLLIFYDLGVCLALGTSARMFFINFFFLINLKDFPVIPVSNVLKSRLKTITDFYVYLSLAWFLGVTLFVILFYPTYDFFAVIVLLSLIILGVLTFFTPQIMFRKYLVSSYKTLCDLCLYDFYDKMGIKLVERISHKHKVFNNSKISNFNSLVEIIAVSNKPPLWVYDSEDFLILFIGQLLPFIIWFLQSHLQKIL